MSENDEIAIDDLRDAWTSLASNGTPPASEISSRVLPAWSFGLDAWLDRLSAAYLRDYCRRNSHFKLAVAPYGGGKTHFLLTLAARATKENWATCFLQCKAGLDISDWYSLYEQAARSIMLPSGGKGIKAIAGAALKEMQRLAADKPDPQEVVDMLIEEAVEKDWPNASFGRVMGALLTHLRDPREKPELGAAALRWLEGQAGSLSAKELGQLHLQRIVGANRKTHGRELLYSLVRFLPRTGCHGLVLLLDEMDSILTAKGSALEQIMVAMRVMLDSPDGLDRTPLFGVFAAVPEISQQIKKYQALVSRFQVTTPFHSGDDNAPQLDLSELGNQQEILRGIGQKLLELGVKAHGWNFSRQLQEQNLERLANVTANQVLQVSSRRLFVKTWCSILAEQSRTGERAFPSHVLTERVQGVYQTFRDAEEKPSAKDIG